MATVRLDQKKRALVRSIPSSFTKALARYFGTGPTDVDLARSQQQAYVDALEANGVTVHRLEADENHPDCMFVEDQAVVVDGHMLLPTPGHPSRVAEQPPIADFLMEALEGVQTCTMGGEARMDGGDIIRLGDLFFVGRSSRTNDLGIASLASLGFGAWSSEASLEAQAWQALRSELEGSRRQVQIRWPTLAASKKTRSARLLRWFDRANRSIRPSPWARDPTQS